MELTKLETRKLIQRGHKGFATLLPKEFLEEHNVNQGDELSCALSPDKQLLFILPKDIRIKDYNKRVELEKKYALGMHVVRSKYGTSSYPILTIPQRFTIPNELKAGSKIDIYKTDQNEYLVIKKSKDE